MNEQTVAEWLAAGEGEQSEFKEKYSSRVIESLVALANTAGGHVLIGVNDRGRVVGLADPARVVESVISACREAVSPPLAPTVEIVRLPEGDIVVAQIEATGRMHAKGGAIFLRHGRQTRRASGEEIRFLTLRETPEVYETLPCPGATWEDMDQAVLSKYFELRAPDALKREGVSLARLAVGQTFATERGGEIVPSVAGMVLFGQADRMSFNWRITALRIRGRELTDPIVDRQDLAGPVDNLVREGESFVRNRMRVAYAGFEADGVTRREVPEYPLRAVREALANAVSHRDYSVPSQVQLRMYDDRLEVQSPGGLLPGLTLAEALQGGAPKRRNNVVTRVLWERGLVEAVGFGFALIRQQMRALGAPEPHFEARPSLFLVTLPSRLEQLPEADEGETADDAEI